MLTLRMGDKDDRVKVSIFPAPVNDMVAGDTDVVFFSSCQPETEK